MRVSIFLIAVIIANSLCAQVNTDIWLFEIENKNGQPLLKNGKNITKRKGYDNQPSFSLDSKSIYFTSRRDSTQTDIYKYQIQKGETDRVTSTPTSEYSPAISPSGNLSVLMVEADSSQHIWEFPIMRKSKIKRVFPKTDSIGYYIWSDTSVALCFLLGGKQNPNRISLINSDGGEVLVAERVGRGMKLFPAAALITRPASDTTFHLYRWKYYGDLTPLVKAPGRSQDLAVWDRYTLMAHESVVYSSKMTMVRFTVNSMEEFQPHVDLSSFGLKRITRIAVSPDEKWIAIVAADEES